MEWERYGATILKFDLARLFSKRSKAPVESNASDAEDAHPLSDKPGWSFTGSTWRYADAASEPMLNLGCGNHFHAAWVNMDVVACDPSVIAHNILEPLPFEDATFGVVYHSHVLEHLPKGRAPGFLQECRRVLKPGGIIRVAVPDLEQICRLYLYQLDRISAGDAEAARRYDWIVLELLDQMTRQRSGGEMLDYWRQEQMPASDFVFARVGEEAATAIARLRSDPEAFPADVPRTAEEIGRFRLSGETHQWMYDRYSLGRLLGETGFAEASVKAAGDSAIADFSSFGLDQMPNGATRKPDSLFMEAIRPHSS